MAPPKKTGGPMVRRMIQLEPSDVERLARVTERLGEGSDASTIRRLIREADAPAKPTYPVGFEPVPGDEEAAKGVPGAIVRLQRATKPAAAFKPHPKPNAGKTTKGRK